MPREPTNIKLTSMVISNLKKKSFRSALATETTDITEEIYITIYEIKKKKKAQHSQLRKLRALTQQKKVHMIYLIYQATMQFILLKLD